MRERLLILLAVLLFILGGVIWVMAQDGQEVSSAACAPALEALWTAASDVCLGGPAGYFCNGGSPPSVQPDGAVKQALAARGALVEVKAVSALRTAPLTMENGRGGLVWLRSKAPIQFTALMVGDVSLWNISPPDFTPWQSLVVQTAPDSTACGVSPRNALILQTPFQKPANLAVNGVSLSLNGTVVVRTSGDQTIFAALSGQADVFSVGSGQLLRAGQQTAVKYQPGVFTAPITPPNPPLPLDETLVEYLPVALLDRSIILPQPGFVTTAGTVNLRTKPAKDAPALLQVPGGQVLTVLGRNPAGDWLHVRLESGETGWMLGQLLIQNVGAIQAVYESTPLPPQRFGESGKVAVVRAPAGVNLRAAPDVTFAALGLVPDGVKVNLIARSPYSPWVKVEYGPQTGWLALITLETQAVIEALPIDYDVPPPPKPTRVPGSFGNAFPDPRNGGG